MGFLNNWLTGMFLYACLSGSMKNKIHFSEVKKKVIYIVINSVYFNYRVSSKKQFELPENCEGKSNAFNTKTGLESTRVLTQTCNY